MDTATENAAPGTTPAEGDGLCTAPPRARRPRKPPAVLTEAEEPARCVLTMAEVSLFCHAVRNLGGPRVARRLLDLLEEGLA